MPDNTTGKKSRGRPREHSSDAVRTKAHRERYGLHKVTVDVPTELTQELRHFALLLRLGSRIKAPNSWKIQTTKKGKEFHQPSENPFKLHIKIYKEVSQGEVWIWFIKDGRKPIANGRSPTMRHAAFCVAFIECSYVNAEYQADLNSQEWLINYYESIGVYKIKENETP